MKTDLAEPDGPDMGQMALVVRRAGEEMERFGRDLLRLTEPFTAALAELIAARRWQIRAGSPRPLCVDGAAYRRRTRARVGRNK